MARDGITKGWMLEAPFGLGRSHDVETFTLSTGTSSFITGSPEDDGISTATFPPAAGARCLPCLDAKS